MKNETFFPDTEVIYIDNKWVAKDKNKKSIEDEIVALNERLKKLEVK